MVQYAVSHKRFILLSIAVEGQFEVKRMSAFITGSLCACVCVSSQRGHSPCLSNGAVVSDQS